MAAQEGSGLQDEGVVLEENGVVYSETMSLVDLGADINSYYLLQAILKCILQCALSLTGDPKMHPRVRTISCRWS